MKLKNLKKAGFGNRGNRDTPYEDYLNKLVVITKLNGEGFVGRYIGISKDDNMVFTNYDSMEHSIFGRRKIISNDYKEIRPTSIEGIELITRENLEEYCLNYNVGEFRSEQEGVSKSLKISFDLRGQLIPLNGLKQ